MRAEDDSRVLRLLSERRDDLAAERTRTVNRLHVLLHALIPGGAKRNPTADEAACRVPALRAACREGADQTFMALTGRPWMDETLGAAR